LRWRPVHTSRPRNQILAVIFLLAGFLSYLARWYTIAYLSTAFVAIAAVVAMSGFCVGCFIRYQWGQYRYRKGRDLQTEPGVSCERAFHGTLEAHK